MARWWVVEVRGLFLCRVFASEAELRAHLGPYVAISGNGVNVLGRPA